MDLVLIRHGIAEPRDDGTDRPDAVRALTKKGRRRMRQVAKGLTRVVPRVDVVLTSPYARAVQTADIVAAAYAGVTVDEVPGLAPDGSQTELLTCLGTRAPEETVAVVGHEPYLGQLTAQLIAATQGHFVDLRPGGVCCLRWADRPAAGEARLRWALTPGLLRKLRRV